jgi:hypothetical protein
MGIIAISAPRVNRPIPSISITAPIMKVSIIPLFIGKNMKERKKTLIVTGSTDEKDSFSFSSNIVLLCLINSLFSFDMHYPFILLIIIYHIGTFNVIGNWIKNNVILSNFLFY